ncbi:MAG: peptide chain release factor 2 [Leptotrichiaceae bacterium]|nr:peptide chain release factor 2 [Leptotrichiaceae bacterium]MBP6281338.1 peptide chain release factor 2 [Leptotrichiaceae bacterium]MBP7100959.1 peptide chain release factor 2 [Leptotrichiaceae bacterium]
MDLFEIKKLNEKNIINIEEIRRHLDLDDLNNKINDLEKNTLKENFWNSENSKEILKEVNILKKLLEEYRNINNLNDEVQILLEFIEMGDNSFEEELNKKIINLELEIQTFKIKLLLDEKYDSNNAILTINSGAGGTEACDWTEMLYRMYDRWSNQNGFKIEILDSLSGEEAGIKSITLNIKGNYAYGYLKGEKGVHRLVRISPFDSNSRRHTSFAAVNVIPEIEDDVEINMKIDELKIDTYRASGAGGQHVNTTDSAVRITHLPTNIVVTCQNERSQLKNRETAMKILKSKLFELELEKKEKEMKDLKGVDSKIEWGSQIRSYVFQPYKMIKDHRTKAEEGNVEKVMDGNINYFINEYLKFLKS